jgi:hypothetical protein
VIEKKKDAVSKRQANEPEPDVIVRVETRRSDSDQATMDALHAGNISVLDALVYYNRRRLTNPRPFNLLTAFARTGLTLEAFIFEVKAVCPSQHGIMMVR